MYSNPTNIGNFPFFLSTLIWCNSEIEPLHTFRAGCHFLQTLIWKMPTKSLDVFLWASSVASTLAADMRRENERSGWTVYILDQELATINA
jgi:hypothetical protein